MIEGIMNVEIKIISKKEYFLFTGNGDSKMGAKKIITANNIVGSNKGWSNTDKI
ncbi:MAG: hypothetical protein IIA88_02435 [Bacteroidetes bacterium]|nr:hypothetical protein [Bacteroidota bacterium]